MRIVVSILWLCFSCLIGQAQILEFSGARVGPLSLINTSGFQAGIGNEFAFLNLVKSMGAMSAGGGYAYPGQLNSDNLPAASIATDTFGQIALPQSYSGNFVFGFAGTAGGAGVQLTLGSAITIVSDPQSCVSGSTSFNLTVVGTNCVVTFNWGTSHSAVTLRFLAGSTYSSFAAPYLVRSDQLSAYNANVTAGQTWGGMNPDWVTKIRALNPRVLRTMTWSGLWVTGSAPDAYNAYANRTPTTSISYFANYWSPANWFGTIAGTNTYTINTGRTGAYVNGEMIQGEFTNANTVTTPTLNDNSRGAVNIQSFAAQGLFAGSIANNQLATLVYDGTLNKFLMGHSGIAPNAPLEVMVAACNSIPVDCWINIPWLVDGNSDITAIATYVANNLNAAHVAYFEWGNEVWNFGNNVTNWAQARGAAMGFPSAACSTTQQIYDYYALRHSQVMALITSAWASAGRTAGQLKRVMAWQAFGDKTTNGCTQAYRFNGTDLSSFGFNTAPNRPIDATHTDIGTYATYYEGFQAPGAQTSYVSHGLSAITPMLAWADEYAAGGTGPAVALAGFDGDVRSSSGQDLNTLNTTIYPAWNTMLSGYGLTIVNYEGGFEGTFPTAATCTTLGMTTGNNTKYCGSAGEINALILAYQNSALFLNTSQLQWAQFSNYSQSFAPGWFELFPYSQWSAFSGDLYSTPFQSWNMMVNWNSH